jgi:hypothetical protein
MKTITAKEESTSSEKQSRSNIVFPYFDLDQSIKVATAIHENGGGRCTPEQLAPWLGYSTTKSGTFMMRFYSAKYFGLINSVKSHISLTDRALAIIAPITVEETDRAKIDAFLDVPLFAQVYERFKGQALPPEIGLKNLFKTQFNIPDVRVQQALRVFFNSATQAGFFKIGGDRSRLITPVITRQPEKKETLVSKEEPQEKPRYSGGSGSGGEGPPGIHSAIIGLLREMPPPGMPWSAQKKEAFLAAFKATIAFIYPEENSP